MSAKDRLDPLQLLPLPPEDPHTAAAAPQLVLIHGMWDTPRLFDRLRRKLAERRGPLLIPHLPHRFGLTPI